jgi:predicted ATP-dependent serine protease
MVYDVFQDWCYCGALFSIVQMPNANKISLRNVDNIHNNNGKEIEGFEFLGKLPIKWYMLVWGNPGGGKSTFCLKLLSRLAQNNPRRLFLYWSCEEGFSESLSYKIEKWDIKEKNIFYSIAKNLNDLMEEIEKYNPGCLVVDSIDRSGLKSKDMLFIKKILYCPIVAVSHITKNNKHRGTSDLAHDTEINVKVEDGTAIIIKNRFGPSGQKMKIFDKQEQQKQQDKGE